MNCNAKTSSRQPDAVALLLARIARRAFVGSLVTTWAGCTALESPEPTDAHAPSASSAQVVPPNAGGDPWSAPGCYLSNKYFLGDAAGLRPREAYDYVAIRNLYARERADGGATPAGWTLTDFKTLSAVGTPCATATGPDCEHKVAHHLASPHLLCSKTMHNFCVERAVVTTRGDEVQRWAGRADLLALLAPIDTLDEASLLLNHAGYELNCNEAKAAVRTPEGAFEVTAGDLSMTCNGSSREYRLSISPDGEVAVLSTRSLGSLSNNTCSGRKPSDFTLAPCADGATTLGRFLAEVAVLEAASVVSFALLAEELRAHGAPAALVARALEARDDEVRHAETMTALARARGGVVTQPTLAAQSVRGLEAIAHENAVEGCVRETYGALVGAHQAAHATDLGVRRAMVSIAEDEARHAALSHAVHAWIMPRLDAPAQARIEAAQREAVAELARACAVAPDASTRAFAGLPDAHVARVLLDALDGALWLRPATSLTA